MCDYKKQAIKELMNTDTSDIFKYNYLNMLIKDDILIDKNFNINCVKCNDCKFCINCFDNTKCLYCINCVKLINCVKCMSCDKCVMCDDCYKCYKCIDCKDCVECVKCKRCGRNYTGINTNNIGSVETQRMAHLKNQINLMCNFINDI